MDNESQESPSQGDDTGTSQREGNDSNQPYDADVDAGTGSSSDKSSNSKDSPEQESPEQNPKYA